MCRALAGLGHPAETPSPKSRAAAPRHARRGRERGGREAGESAPCHQRSARPSPCSCPQEPGRARRGGPELPPPPPGMGEEAQASEHRERAVLAPARERRDRSEASPRPSPSSRPPTPSEGPRSATPRKPPAWPGPEAGRGKPPAAATARVPSARAGENGKGRREERRRPRRRETGEEEKRPRFARSGTGSRARGRRAAPDAGRRTAAPRLHAPASERASERREARRDKPLCRGLTFNRSQRGSCSATYETPTQKQVVYEWFSARFHTNVRSA